MSTPPPPPAPGRRVAEGALTLAILVAFLGIWPVGEYAVEDDWAYAQSLYLLRHEGMVRILDWNPMTLVTHLAWGVLFTLPGGFSFTASKLSVVVLLWLGGLLLLNVLRHLEVPEGTATLVTLAMVLHPIHLFQGFLYGTDVPAGAWGLLALLGYLKALAGPRISLPWLWLGSLGVALGWGIRQSGVVLLGAVFAYLLLYDRRSLRRPGVLLGLGVLPALAVVGFSGWYFYVHGPTVMFEQSRRDVWNALAALNPSVAARVVYYLLIYAAFFALPLLVALPGSSWRPRRGTAWGRVGLAGAAACLGLALWVSFGAGERFPYLRNKITQFGMLSPNEVLVGDRPVLWGAALGWNVSALLALTLALAVLLLARAAGREEESPARRNGRRLVALLLLAQLVYCFLTQAILYDRHLLLYQPAVLVLLALALGEVPLRRWIAWPLLLGLALYGVLCAHDVHAFSRKAFDLGRELMAEGVSPRRIDAGYAFDGWHMHQVSWYESREKGLPGRARRTDPWWIRFLAPRVFSQYMVSLSPTLEPTAWEKGLAPWARPFATMPDLRSYRILRRDRYFGYWPWGWRPIYVLEDLRPAPVAP
jgi:hypothetical protein